MSSTTLTVATRAPICARSSGQGRPPRHQTRTFRLVGHARWPAGYRPRSPDGSVTTQHALELSNVSVRSTRRTEHGCDRHDWPRQSGSTGPPQRFGEVTMTSGRARSAPYAMRRVTGANDRLAAQSGMYCRKALCTRGRGRHSLPAPVVALCASPAQSPHGLLEYGFLERGQIG